MSILLGHAIADARFRAYDAWLRRVALDLLAQLADEDPEIMQVVAMGRSPDGCQQRAVRED